VVPVKNWLARAIHSHSLRAEENFVQLTARLIPEELIESELFGHEKGAFTGATERQLGKLNG
jgi:DNA-binding NtrC family response regulator